MEDVIAQGTAGAATLESPGISRAQMPLSFLRVGESARIACVRGREKMQHHLANLGFVENAEIRVMNECAGNLIIEVKGCQVAIDKQIATKVITK